MRQNIRSDCNKHVIKREHYSRKNEVLNYLERKSNEKEKTFICENGAMAIQDEHVLYVNGFDKDGYNKYGRNKQGLNKRDIGLTVVATLKSNRQFLLLSLVNLKSYKQTNTFNATSFVKTTPEPSVITVSSYQFICACLSVENEGLQYSLPI